MIRQVETGTPATVAQFELLSQIRLEALESGKPARDVKPANVPSKSAQSGRLEGELEHMHALISERLEDGEPVPDHFIARRDQLEKLIG